MRLANGLLVRIGMAYLQLFRMEKVDHFRVVLRYPLRITDDLSLVQYQVRQSFEKRESILLANLRVIVHLNVPLYALLYV